MQPPKNTVSHHSGESNQRQKVWRVAGCGGIGIIRTCTVRVSGFGIEARSAEARAGTNDESRAYYVVSALKPCHHLSEEDDGTAAAARQLGSMSLGKSAKIEPENKTNEDAEKNGTSPTIKICSACEKKGEALKKAHGLQVCLVLRQFSKNGGLGLPVDQTKCIDLLRESAGLGCSVAQYQLGAFHSTGAMGIEKNEEEELKYWETAAEGSDLISRHNLGCTEDQNGDHVAAMRHWRLSASGGIHGVHVLSN